MRNKSYDRFVNTFPNNPIASKLRRGLKDVKTGMNNDFTRRQQEMERAFENKYGRGLKDD